jgi:tetratricopeptide (TPR) repeat protein
MPEIRKMYTVGLMRARYLQAAAHVYNRAGLFEPAEQNAREALEAIRGNLLPEVHPMAAEGLEDLGRALAGLKRNREAAPALEKAVKIYRKLGPAYSKTADSVQVILDQAQKQL